MIRLLGERIVIQAIKDLTDSDEFNRVEAISFFMEGDHEYACNKAGIDANELADQVHEAIRHDGIRREKLVSKILSNIPRNIPS